ncbi:MULTISPECIES: ParB N-terminal domain-containing protein [Kitasatospora]|uniref:ParB N-terminal domain-containing protein n=1 Tax=Kitasatospora TaxID=2063 RepID=UPI001EEBCC39|nr:MULTISPECIES: ParB N-terminal domain-containing protein [Kitasatospora]MCG6496988.1 plasmid replication/partition related protein [Kitasatospora sp. A2-31]MCX4758801.1 plasmid replication/partition related protein [Kitasatospora purpeofusca]WSR30771.1 plasmid replication/partition related protein [Kitasatospora purpeofusca]
MLDDEELLALAEDIKANGQYIPIMLDPNGRLLDGRNRLAACKVAGVEPEFATYNGPNPGAYALRINIRRRNLTKGQSAMVAAKACSVSEPSGRIEFELSARSIAEQIGVSLGRIGQAMTVARHAPDLMDQVISGAVGLDEAYKTAREAKAQADSAENQLARLRAEDPELADKVVEGEIGLAAAWVERKERADEEVRRRQVATQFLCEVVPPLAQARGTDTVALYDPQFMLTGRAITGEVIEQAMAALSEMAQAWREREAA